MKEYKYTDLYPGHHIFSSIAFWDGQDSEFIHCTCLERAIEEVIDDFHPDPICDMGIIQILGYEWRPDCPKDEYPIQGDPIVGICRIKVDALSWTKKNMPHWLGNPE